MRNIFPFVRPDSEVIACFGAAKLIRHLDGRIELQGGSQSDETTAKEWISLFMHEAVPNMMERRSAGAAPGLAGASATAEAPASRRGRTERLRCRLP